MKNCPECKATCFDDMDRCYACMHRFNKKENYSTLEKGKPSNEFVGYVNNSNSDFGIENDFIPEYFEIESFPMVECIDYVRDEQISNYDSAFIDDWEDSVIDPGNDYISFEQLDEQKEIKIKSIKQEKDHILLQLFIPKRYLS